MFFDNWSEESKRNAMIAAGFAVFIVVLIIVLLCKWPPSQWCTKKRKRKVQFDDNIQVHVMDDTDEGPLEGMSTSAPHVPPQQADAVQDDQILRDAQNRHALQLRGGQLMRGGAPTTSAMLFGSHNTRLEMSTRTTSGSDVPPEAANVLPV